MSSYHNTSTTPAPSWRRGARKPRLSPGAHREAGHHLACIHDYLTAISAAVCNAYPRTSEAHKLARGLSEQVDRPENPAGKRGVR
jgi:hypothetical protein